MYDWHKGKLRSLTQGQIEEINKIHTKASDNKKTLIATQLGNLRQTDRDRMPIEGPDLFDVLWQRIVTE